MAEGNEKLRGHHLSRGVRRRNDTRTILRYTADWSNIGDANISNYACFHERFRIRRVIRCWPAASQRKVE